MRADFDNLQRDMRGLAGSVGDAASSSVSDAAASVSGAANGAAEQVEEWAEEGTTTVRDAIRAQPLAAIAISMGAGAIIGTLLRR